MNHDKTSTTEETIQLPTFAVRKIGDRIMTRCIGTFTLKLSSDTKSHTKGSIDIEGRTIPILSSSLVSRVPDKSIDHGSCLLLLETDQSTDNFKIGYFVNDLFDIPKITKEII